MTPAPNRTRMPDQIKKDARDPAGWRNERGRLFSVYMRPWTLIKHYANRFVPFLADLDVVPNRNPRRYSAKKAPRSADVIPRSFHAAWKWYIDGNIVSEHQRRIIVQFMSVNCGRSTTRDNDGEEEREDKGPEDKKAYANSVGISNIHRIIGNMIAKAKEGEDASGGVVAAARDASSSAIQLGTALWGPHATPWPEEALDASGVGTCGDPAQADENMPEGDGQARRARKGLEMNMYARYSEAAANKWLEKIKKEVISPNEEQEKYLKAVMARCSLEAREMARMRPQETKSSPETIALLAPPGTGKSECIKWTTRFFKECLQWTEGVQYQCLASQNRMAALIGGTTLHSWGEVPVDTENTKFKEKKKSKDGHSEMFMKCVSMRWLLIDEISTSALWATDVRAFYILQKQ